MGIASGDDERGGRFLLTLQCPVIGVVLTTDHRSPITDY
jgi:hypothetical protein